MKKMIILCVIPFVLAALFIVSIVCVQTGISYPFITKKGSISYVKDVGFDVLVKGAESSDALQINIHNQEGSSTHSFLYHVYDYDFGNYEPSNGQASKVSASPRSFLTVIDASSNEDATCTKTKEKANAMPVIYDFYFFDNNTQLYMYGDDENAFEIKTNLNYISNEQLQLYKESLSCLMDENDKNSEYVAYEIYGYETNEMVEQGGAVVEGKRKHEYYFMPFTNTYIEGQNKIYKINLKNNADNLYATSTEFLKLPLERYYYGMVMDDHQFYIVASVNGTLQLMEYTIDGELLKETFLTNNDDGLSIRRMQTYNDYVLIETSNQILVYNTRKATLINTITKTATMKESYIEDMIYKNDLLYVLVNTSENDVENKHNKLQYLKNRVELNLQVIKDDTLVYEGIQHIYDSGKNNHGLMQNIYMESAKFIRGAV